MIAQLKWENNEQRKKLINHGQQFFCGFSLVLLIYPFIDFKNVRFIIMLSTLRREVDY